MRYEENCDKSERRELPVKASYKSNYIFTAYNPGDFLVFREDTSYVTNPADSRKYKNIVEMARFIKCYWLLFGMDYM